MTPTLRTLRLLGAWFFLGLGASLWEPFAPVWLGAGVLLLLAAGIDASLCGLQPRLTLERKLPSRFALGIAGEVTLTLHNSGRAGVKVECFDGLPAMMQSPHLPWSSRIPAHGHCIVRYAVRAVQRGLATFTSCHIRHLSPLGLWHQRYFAGGSAETRVYPNYEPVVRYTLLAVSHRESQMGIIARNRAGQSREFHQLREYQDGDVLSQVDWKATARRGQLVSRQYREQRDQNIILLLDCGRRLRAMDGEVSQFDHCLNASLLLAYIALRQGDNVGAMGFGGIDRWMPPVRGQHSMNRVLNHLYDYECTTSATDFTEAAERIMARQRRRALVVLLTNLRGEEGTHLLPPLQLLRRRHLVVVATLREYSISQRLKKNIETLDDALFAAAAHSYLAERATLLAGLRDHGILSIDVTAQELAGALASTYLDIKQRGTL